jgi:hypothetical protein
LARQAEIKTPGSIRSAMVAVTMQIQTREYQTQILRETGERRNNAKSYCGRDLLFVWLSQRISRRAVFRLNIL